MERRSLRTDILGLHVARRVKDICAQGGDGTGQTPAACASSYALRLDSPSLLLIHAR